MLFTDNRFTPEAVTEPRARRILDAISAVPREPLRPVDLLAGLVRAADAATYLLLKQVLQPDHSMDDLVHVSGDPGSEDSPPAGPRSRESFTTEALAILDEFALSLGDDKMST